jgi:tetratricopeptide (TPR) repeat protein
MDGWTVTGTGLEEGARIIDHALELNPNSAAAWAMSGWTRSYLGEGKIAVEHFKKAMRLSPRDPIAHTFKSGMALAWLTDGKYEQSLEWANLALADQPKFLSALRLKAAALGMLNRIAEAKEAGRALLEITPHLTIASLPFLRWRKDSSGYIEGLRRAGIPEK